MHELDFTRERQLLDVRCLSRGMHAASPEALTSAVSVGWTVAPRQRRTPATCWPASRITAAQSAARSGRLRWQPISL